jgi:DNA primase
MRNDDDLSELLDALDIEAWCDAQGVDYIATRGRSGRQLNIRTCPTCGSDGHKVYLNADTGLGNCNAGRHPPGETFNKWKFIRASLGDVSGRQVVEHIRHFVSSRGWTPKRTTTKVQKAPQLIMPDSYPLPFQGRNIAYLEGRGIDSATAAYFHLRYCHEGYFPYEFDGKMQLQNHSQSVIIPVFDLDGNMVTFQSRDITGQRRGPDGALKKYLFPPGLPSTGAHLYNGHNVRNTFRVAVGEGAFDVAAVKIALNSDRGLRDVEPVGTFGKHLSWGTGDSQEMKFVELKNRGVEEVTFMWDGEIRATDDAIDAGLRLRKLGLKVRVGMLPKDRDPNEVSASEVVKTFYEAVPLTMQSAVLIKDRRRKMNR